jgi:hypothetical protein
VKFFITTFFEPGEGMGVMQALRLGWRRSGWAKRGGGRRGGVTWKPQGMPRWRWVDGWRSWQSSWRGGPRRRSCRRPVGHGDEAGRKVKVNFFSGYVALYSHSIVSVRSKEFHLILPFQHSVERVKNFVQPRLNITRFHQINQHEFTTFSISKSNCMSQLCCGMYF